MGSKMKWKELLASATDYAANGFPVSTSLAYWSKINTNPNDSEFRNLQRFDAFRKAYLHGTRLDGRLNQQHETENNNADDSHDYSA